VASLVPLETLLPKLKPQLPRSS